MKEEIKIDFGQKHNVYIVGLRLVVNTKSLASESFIPCYLGQQTQDYHSQIRDDVSEKSKVFLVSSCDLPLLDSSY